MDVLFVISTPDAGRVLAPLAAACRRRGASWACFFTSDGVLAINDAASGEAIAHAAESVACEHSWERYQGDQACPVTLGSQTDNSAMVGRAAKVIGL